MKKLFVFILLFATALAFIGCGSGGKGGDSTTPTTPVVTAPTVAPTDPVATPGNATISLSFGLVPASGNGGSEITTYNGECVGSDASVINTTGPSSPIVFTTGVVNGVSYTCKVSAGNDEGEGPKSIASNKATPRIPIEGVGETVTDGTYLYSVVPKTISGQLQNIYLKKSDKKSGALVWEKPVLVTTDYDECFGIVLMDNFAYAFCVQDDPKYPGMGNGVVFVEKINTATGAKTETQWTDYGVPISLAADPATNTLYLCFNAFSNNHIARVDTDINLLASISAIPGDPSVGTFFGKMVVTPDSLLIAGNATQGGSLNRIKVFKYKKDLSSLVESVQYRNFTDDSYLDDARSIVKSNDGSSVFVGGFTKVGSGNQRDVLLKVNIADMSITSAIDLGAGSQRFESLAFDSLGTLYCIQNGSIVIINVTTGVVTNLNISIPPIFYIIDGDELIVTGDVQYWMGVGTINFYDLFGNPL
jgi:hypothetical protein